jgi:hypothetical protein
VGSLKNFWFDCVKGLKQPKRYAAVGISAWTLHHFLEGSDAAGALSFILRSGAERQRRGAMKARYDKRIGCDALSLCTVVTFDMS